MLSNLTIKNYAIIHKLDVDFTNDFCVITGETGAGKSIIMGALSLILGQRADTSVLKNNEVKCVVEGKFNVSTSSEFEAFFKENDLDFENPITLRREIAPSGKSRAFINDTPVQLSIIRALGINLIDIHSQHANLDLGKRRFQLDVIDWYGKHENLIIEYTKLYKSLRKAEKDYNQVFEMSEKSKADLDYFEFQFNQLDEAKLVADELAELEQEQEVLSHSEDIKTGLSKVFELVDGDEFSILQRLKESLTTLQKLSSYLPEIDDLAKRVDSQHIEMQDIASECELLAEKTEHNPTRLEEVSDRLNLLFGLQQKHRVGSVEELIELRDNFDLKIQSAASYSLELEKLSSQINKLKGRVSSAATKLHKARKAQIKGIKTEVESILSQLGMANAIFNIELRQLEEFLPTGNDEVIFQFCANKGGRLEEITKVASGGEMSRLMLAIKTVVAKSKTLPAIIFDEIDNGISGEVAAKMGRILKEMATYMQVISITHLPQIASKGDSHYFVYKEETKTSTETGMRMLSTNERIEELAKMLSGESPNDAAYENAKALLSV